MIQMHRKYDLMNTVPTIFKVNDSTFEHIFGCFGMLLFEFWQKSCGYRKLIKYVRSMAEYIQKILSETLKLGYP